jgi:hypothetical protein
MDAREKSCRLAATNFVDARGERAILIFSLTGGHSESGEFDFGISSKCLGIFHAEGHGRGGCK